MEEGEPLCMPRSVGGGSSDAIFPILARGPPPARHHADRRIRQTAQQGQAYGTSSESLRRRNREDSGFTYLYQEAMNTWGVPGGCISLGCDTGAQRTTT